MPVSTKIHQTTAANTRNAVKKRTHQYEQEQQTALFCEPNEEDSDNEEDDEDHL